MKTLLGSLLLLVCSLGAQQRSILVDENHLPVGAKVVDFKVINVENLAALPNSTMAKFKFKGVKNFNFSTDPCDPSDPNCTDGHGLTPPPDPNCANAASDPNCWYLGWGWYLCYVGC